MGLLYGCAGRLTAQNGGFRPGQYLAEKFGDWELYPAGLLTQGVLTFSTTIQSPYRLLKMSHPLQAQGW